MVSLNTTIRNAMADGRLNLQEAQQVLTQVQSNGSISKGERAALAQLANLPAAKIDDAARTLLQQTLGISPPPPVVTGGSLSLAPGSARPVFLTTSGNFSLDANLDRPRNNVDLGESLFRAASLVADGPNNPFARTEFTPGMREKLLGNLTSALRSVAPGAALPAGLDAKQALQLRSSAATVLLGLAESTSNATPAGADLQKRMVTTYQALVKAETNPALRESMIFNMDASKAALGVDGKAIADTLMKETAPLSLPYDKWFANGNTKVNISWCSGSEFLAGWKTNLKADGWKETSPSSGWGASTWEKTVEKNGVKTTFSLELAGNQDNLFKKMNDPNTQIVGYDGHSDWGRTINRSLANAPGGTAGDDKLVFYGLCVGKGTLGKVRDQYPNAQVVTTYNSSSFYQNSPQDENKGAFMAILDGIANRQPWAPIRSELADADFINPQPLESNYITPVDTMIRRQVMDRDHDGRADMFDKLFSVSTFKPAADRARDFSPLDPGQPAQNLVGGAVFMGVMMLNTISEFNGTLHNANIDGHVRANGFFEGKDSDPVCKFTVGKDAKGKTEFLLQVNSRYAHTSEEAMRIMTLVEFNRFMEAQPGFALKGVDNKLQSLILAAHSLDVDDSWSDDTTWKAFLAKYNFPADISMSTVMASKEADMTTGHWYAGSKGAAQDLKTKLTPAQVQALSSPLAGTPSLGAPVA